MPRFQANSPRRVFGGFVSAGGQRSQTRAGGEQAGGFAIHQLHVIGFGDVDFAQAFQLKQLAFHHHLGEADQQVEHVEVAFAQGNLEGLHVQPVAGKHAGVVAPDGICRWTAAARARGVDHVVVHQRGGVDHLHHGGHAHGGIVDFAHQPRGKQNQNGAQALAATGLQVASNGGDRIDTGHRLETDDALHLLQIGLDQIQNLTCGQRLPELAKGHANHSV
jgi:hypothetical protein